MNRKQAEREISRIVGHPVRLSQGAYIDTCDDVAGTWYIDHNPDSAVIDRRGRGHRTLADAVQYAEEVEIEQGAQKC